MDIKQINVCRFCYDEGTDDQPLSHPCRCSGSIGFVHKTCLDKWLEHTDNSQCTVCKYSFVYTEVRGSDTLGSKIHMTTAQQTIMTIAKFFASSMYLCVKLILKYAAMPYLAYWMLCGFIWFAYEYLPSSGIQQNPFSLDMATKRFEQPMSWKQWTDGYKNGIAGNDVVSFSGLLDGANYSMYVLYNILNGAVLFISWIAGKVALGSISDAQHISIVEITAEMLAKSVEGGIILAALTVSRQTISFTFGWAKTVLKKIEGEDKTINGDAMTQEQRRQKIQQQIQEQQQAFMLQMEQANDHEVSWAEWMRNAVNYILGNDFVLTYVTINMAAFVLLPLCIGRVAVFVMARYPTTPIITGQRTIDYLNGVKTTIVWMHLPDQLRQIIEYLGIDSMILLTPIVLHISKMHDGSDPVQWIHDSIMCAVESVTLDRTSRWIKQVDTGLSIYSRQFTIVLGYVCIATVLIQGFNIAPECFHRHKCYKTLKKATYALYVIISTSSAFLVTSALGYVFRLLFVPFITKRSTQEVLESMLENPWTTMALNVMFGLIVQLVQAGQIYVWSILHRPGLPWGIIINTSHGTKMQAVVRDSKVLGILKKVCTEILGITILELVGVYVPLVVIDELVPGLFPITLDGFSLTANIYTLGLFACACMTYALFYRQINHALCTGYKCTQLNIASMFRLTEYVYGEQRIIDEGTWKINSIPWFSVPLAYLWMPSGTIKDAFKTVPTECHNYNAKLQVAIDAKLAEKYPHLSFTLDGEYYKVPWTNRIEEKPGDPLEKKVGSRDASLDEDEEYRVVYVPPDMKDKRSTFLFLSIIVVQAQFTFFVCLLPAIGRCIWVLEGVRGNKLAAFYCGLEILMLVAAALGGLLIKFREEANWVSVLLPRLWKIVCNVTAITLVFFYIMPMLVGKVCMLYLSVMYTYYYLGADSFAGQKMVGFWGIDDVNVAYVIISTALVVAVRMARSGNHLFDELIYVLIDVFDRDVANMNIWAVVRTSALPIIIPVLALGVFPFALTVIDTMWQARGWTLDGYQEAVLEFKDIALLAKNCRASAVAAAVALAIYLVVRLYRSTRNRVRNRIVSENKQLVNYGEQEN